MGSKDMPGARDEASAARAVALHPARAGGPPRARHRRDRQRQDRRLRAPDPPPPGGAPVRRVRAGGDADEGAGVPAGRAVPRSRVMPPPQDRRRGRRHGQAPAGQGARREAARRDRHAGEDQGVARGES